MAYKTIHMIRHVMPDDRLAHLLVSQHGGIGMADFFYRAGHIHPALAREMADLSGAVADTGLYDLDPFREPHGAEFEAWFEVVPPELAEDRPLRARFGELGWEMQIRGDMVDPALVKELNEIVMPKVCGLLVPWEVYAG
ncbi:MAG TPA: hypothetical protein VD864_03090 [Nocardioides sp.]|nr:hypothetical protein [Nocardioides sp.]